MVLVTGGTGLVGSHLIFDLLKKGYKVKALVRNSSNRTQILQTFAFYCSEPKVLFDKIIWVEGDITDILSLEDAFIDIEQVYHAAAFVSFNHSDRAKIYKNNVDGTSNIVNLCLEKKINKLCFVSSIAAIGVTDDGTPIKEDILWKPAKNQSSYSKSKYKAEMEVWRGITEGLNAVIVNPSVILGPGHKKNGNHSIFKLIANGLPFYTLGITGFVDVRDVTKAMIELMESNISSERFILSTENITYKSFFEMVANVLRVKPPHRYFSPWISSIAWRLEYIRALLFQVPPKLTKNTVDISYKKLIYSSEKVKKTINIDFRPIEKTLTELGQFYAKQLKSIPLSSRSHV